MAGKYINIKKLKNYIDNSKKTVLEMTWSRDGLFNQLPIYVLLCIEQDKSCKAIYQRLLNNLSVFSIEEKYLMDRIKLYSEIYNSDVDKLERKDRIWVNNKSEFASDFET